MYVGSIKIGTGCLMTKIYIASPFSHPRLIVRIYRYIKVCRVAGRLIREGNIVYSPIAHSAPIAWLCRLQGDHATWKEQNRGWISWCDELWVLTIEGWDVSIGIEWEMEMARIMGKRVEVFL